jgi:hypothetical protein
MIIKDNKGTIPDNTVVGKINKAETFLLPALLVRKPARPVKNRFYKTSNYFITSFLLFNVKLKGTGS